MSSPAWPSGLVTHRDLPLLEASSASVSRAVTRGELIRIKRGAYMLAHEWSALTPEQRHRTRVTATAISHPGSVFSHWSAAVIHGLPVIGPWPDVVYVAQERASGGRSEVGVKRHCRGLPAADRLVVDGIRVTSIPRTLVDLATAQPFRFAVAPLDFALGQRMTSIEHLQAQLLEPFRGRRKAMRAMAFADGRSGSPGESMSRAVMHELGFPAPLLQVEHRWAGGRDITDFEWPAHSVIGEFDGLGKYLREELRPGQTVADAVIAEKVREDRLRRSTRATVARWGWGDALGAVGLRESLLAAGLPQSAYAPNTRVRSAMRA